VDFEINLVFLLVISSLHVGNMVDIQRKSGHLIHPAFAIRRNQGSYQNIDFRTHILFVVNSVHIWIN